MASIRHFPASHPLPDWRNFGVMLRVLLGGNALALAAALLQVSSLSAWLPRYVELAAVVEPVLLISLGLLALLRDLLWRVPLRLGQALALALVGAVSTLLYAGIAWLALIDSVSMARAGLLAMMAGVILLGYFELRSRAYSPALAEARLAALNARIRPHFLFNSLNAVLSMIRAQPQRAEAGLESLSDLFRAAMRDPAELVSLADEVDLGRQYLELEGLRLGDRLKVEWQMEGVDPALPIPPLMLQPLLENAVYHGIEPLPEGGTVAVTLSQRKDELRMAIANPTAGRAAHAAGNQIALANIRERLALYYDLEARLEIHADADRYEVQITLPCPTPRP